MQLTRTLARFVAMFLLALAMGLCVNTPALAQVNDDDENTIEIDSEQDQDADQDQDVDQENDSTQTQTLDQDVEQDLDQEQNVDLTQTADVAQDNAFNAGGEYAEHDYSWDDNDTEVGDTNQANASVVDQDQDVDQNGEQDATLNPVLTQDNEQTNVNNQDLDQDQESDNIGTITDNDQNTDDDEIDVEIDVDTDIEVLRGQLRQVLDDMLRGNNGIGNGGGDGTTPAGFEDNTR